MEQNDNFEVNEDNDDEMKVTENCKVCDVECGTAHKCIICKRFVHAICGENDEDNEGFGSKVICFLCANIRKCRTTRAKAKKNLTIQAEKMMSRCEKLHPMASVGQNVTIPIPDPDKSKASFRNIIGVIMKIEDSNHTVGTKFGIINVKYSRGEFDIAKECFVKVNDVPKNLISLRTAAKYSSIGNRQGYSRCYCKTDCMSQKCLCKKTRFFAIQNFIQTQANLVVKITKSRLANFSFLCLQLTVIQFEYQYLKNKF